MKKITNALLVLMLLAFGACTDLEVPPEGLAPEVFFQDEENYRAFLARVYSGLAVSGQEGPAGNGDISSLDEGFSQYLRQYWQLQELTTDEAIIAWGDEGLPDLHNHTWTAANQFVNAMFFRIAFQISIANEFMRETTPEKLDEREVSDGTRADIVNYRAEARWLRALSYWHAIDMFGQFPFYTEESPFGGNPPAPGSRQEIFEFLVSELNDAEADMVEPGAQEYGRADRAALWMLQAKLYLNAEVYTGTPRYTEALGALNKVIETGLYSISDPFQNMFLTENHTSTEFIFAIPFEGLRTQSFGGMTYLTHAPVGGSMNDVAEPEFGINGGWFGLRTTSAIVDLFPSETTFPDSRALFWTDGQTKDIGSISDFTNGYGLPKYRNVSPEGVIGTDLVHPDTDFPMFRLADTYLMYAEAVLRGGTGGDLGTAVGYINELRERAYGNENGNIDMATLDLPFVLDERGRELYWEGHRRTDLVRFNQFTENGVWPWKGGVAEGQTTGAFRNLFPIPSTELLANPNLSQNPEY
ncbi:MAG: RagB/SusD family nutrient uptake outer membrane protein [Bacteroidota bacterium]